MPLVSLVLHWSTKIWISHCHELIKGEFSLENGFDLRLSWR